MHSMCMFVCVCLCKQFYSVCLNFKPEEKMTAVREHHPRRLVCLQHPSCYLWSVEVDDGKALLWYTS